MQREKKLEEFRSFRTSKRRKRRVNKEKNEEAVREKMLKLRIVCVKRIQMRD